MPTIRTILPALLLAACAAPAGAPAPEEVALGLDACDYCHMVIDDPDRAAEWVREDGHAHKFDEPGCLLAWLQGNPAVAGAAFLADLEGGGWVPAGEATLLRGGVRTSMGFDIVAFRAADAARARVRDAGATVESWETLRREGVEDVRSR